MKKILVLLIFALGCTTEEESDIQTQETTNAAIETVVEEVTPDFNNDSIYSKVNPLVLNSYWKAFVKSAALYGVDLSNIEEVTFIPEDLGGSTAGVANGSCEEYVLISVDETVFRNLTRGEQIFLMYHELGHDVFNASHAGGGLMAPNVRSLEYKLFQTEVEDFFTGEDYIEWTEEECEIIRDLTDN